MNNTTFVEDISKIYEKDIERRKRLSEIADTLMDAQDSLDMKQNMAMTKQLQERINSETFKILVIGEFNVGKSTFINALLGKEILPTKAIPATAIINRIQYGGTPSAWLHYEDKSRNPTKVPIDSINEYVLIKQSELEAAKEEIRSNPINHVKIFYPLELCKDNNVEIIDSPGLNENAVRESVTLDYLRQVDAILFIMSSVKFGPAQTEMDTIKMLESAGHKDLFFVINQWDMLRPRQKKEVEGKALEELKKLTDRKEDIYFVSALDALEGRMEGNKELEAKSGFKNLESSLHQFLATEQGRIKSIRSSRELRRVIREMSNIGIPQRINLLEMPLGELKKKYEVAKTQLDRLELDKRDILNFTSRERSQVTRLTRGQIRDFFFSVGGQIDSWASSYDINIGIPTKKKIEEAVKGLSEFLSNKMEEAFQDWEKSSLTPFIERRIESLYKELEIRAVDFETHLQEAHFSLSGAQFIKEETGDGVGPKNALERILAAAGGFFVGGIGAGAIGAVFGYQEMLKSLIPNILAIVAALVIGLPVLPVMLIVGAIFGVKAAKGISGKIRVQVSNNFKEELNKNSSNHAEQIVQQLDQKLEELEKTLKTGMENQINSVREQAEAALSDHEKGEREVQRKLNDIDTLKKEMSKINEEIDQFIDGLVIA